MFRSKRVARRVFEAAEHAFDDVAVLKDSSILVVLKLAVSAWRDDGLRASPWSCTYLRIALRDKPVRRDISRIEI